MIPGVKPSVLSTPTSRVLSRTAIAIVLPVTSRIVNVTAARIDSRNTLTLLRKARKLNWNAFSVSVLVWSGALRN
jgi:hypothetical protein